MTPKLPDSVIALVSLALIWPPIILTLGGAFSQTAQNLQLDEQLQISVSGLSQMLPSLLEEILKEIEIFEITEAEFEIGKKAQIEDYSNTLIKPKARFQMISYFWLVGQ